MQILLFFVVALFSCVARADAGVALLESIADLPTQVTEKAKPPARTQDGAKAEKAKQDGAKKPHDANVIVTSDWLAEQLKKGNKDIRVLDLALRNTNYKLGHIPGAIFVDWRKEIISTEKENLYRLPSKSQIEKLMSKAGVGNDSTVIVADNTKNRMAVRMYFTLKYFGHKNVRILDGGTTAWKASGKELSIDLPKVKPANYKVSTTNDKFVVSMKAVEQALGKDIALIDGRPTKHYDGTVNGKTFHKNQPHKRKGHVPGAVNIPWEQNMNADSTFKSLDELRELYDSHGIDTDTKVITYCNEGLHAAMPWFVLTQLLGNSQTTVYDDSMAEWANTEKQPLKVGAEK